MLQVNGIFEEEGKVTNQSFSWISQDVQVGRSYGSGLDPKRYAGTHVYCTRYSKLLRSEFLNRRIVLASPGLFIQELEVV